MGFSQKYLKNEQGHSQKIKTVNIDMHNGIAN